MASPTPLKLPSFDRFNLQGDESNAKRVLMASPTPLQVPTIDLTDLQPGTAAWDAARAEVMAALATWGCFVAVYGSVGPEFREGFSSRLMDDFFALPLETKMKGTCSDPASEGYVNFRPHFDYESRRVEGALELDGAERFTRLMWPDGNPTFCKAVWTFSKLMKELEQMIERMVLQGLGLEKHFDSHMESIEHAFRLSRYGVPLNPETKIGLSAHKDLNIFTIIGQQRVRGLEVLAKNGEWVLVEPSANSFTVVVGEMFEVWTNGRFKAPWHRVKIEANEERYATVFGSKPKKGYLVQTPEELVDEEHPFLFKPLDYYAYLEFFFSEEGKKVKDTLRAYCGVAQEELKA